MWQGATRTIPGLRPPARGSQGTGHAAYATFLYEFYRGAFISGPQNCCGKLYVDRDFATPVERMGALYHLLVGPRP